MDSAESSDAVEFWRRTLRGGRFKTWVVFEHGTCVVLREPQADPAEQARALLAKWGPVHAGTPSGDFTVKPLLNAPEKIVTAITRTSSITPRRPRLVAAISSLV